MANILDYIRWRGDLSFRLSPPNEVDALIFSTLSYISFRGRTAEKPEIPISQMDAAKEYFSHPDPSGYVRTPNDLELLKGAGESKRFGSCYLTRYQQVFITDPDTQFAGVTFLLDDGSIFVSFRGTDNTLAGWNEDFDMAYLSPVPARKRAVEYLTDLAR